MERQPEKSTTRELIEQVVVGAAGMIPVVGSPVSVAFATAMTWTYSKRMRVWLDGLAAAISELQDRDLLPSLDDLAASEVFADAVVNATRAAQATHQREKLDALRNGVLNSLGPDAPIADEQARFFRLVEELNPAHLRLLAFLDDPGQAFDRAGIARPNPIPGSVTMLIEAGLPEFNGRRDWSDLLLFDMSTASLTLLGSAGGQTSTGRDWARWPWVSALGSRFLTFISPTP